jgi:hypothetical protein
MASPTLTPAIQCFIILRISARTQTAPEAAAHLLAGLVGSDPRAPGFAATRPSAVYPAAVCNHTISLASYSISR